MGSRKGAKTQRKSKNETGRLGNLPHGGADRQGAMTGGPAGRGCDPPVAAASSWAIEDCGSFRGTRGLGNPRIGEALNPDARRIRRMSWPVRKLVPSPGYGLSRFASPRAVTIGRIDSTDKSGILRQFVNPGVSEPPKKGGSRITP